MEPEDSERDAAEEIRRLRATIRNVVWGVVIVAVALYGFWLVANAQKSADRNADEMSECILAGRSDC